MARTVRPEITDEALIIGALREYADRQEAAPGVPQPQYREFYRRAQRARLLANAYEASLPPAPGWKVTLVDQTILHDPTRPDQIGNCWQAAVATLLRLPLEDVPHFAADPDPTACYDRWLRARRLLSVSLPLGGVPLDMPCLLGGISPRGIAHITVGIGLDIVHDPHPSRDGLSSIEYAYVLVPYLPFAP